MALSEKYNFTPKLLEEKCVDMDIVLPRDLQGPKYYNPTKRIQYTNGTPICRSNENPMLDTIFYDAR